jgi:hypothetical protein
MKARRAWGAGLIWLAFTASAQTLVVPPELWDRPRSGAAVMARTEIRQAVDAWLARPGERLVVHHGPGQESVLQAEELRAWLIALAIEAERIALRNDLSSREPLSIEVVRH